MIRYLLFFIAVGLNFDQASGQTFETVSLKENVEAWAVDATSGRVFAAFNESPTGHAGQVTEIDRQGKRLQTFLLDNAPKKLFVVQDRLVVFSITPLQLNAFSLKTNEPAGSLLIPGVGAGSICTGGIESSFLYVFNIAASGSRVGSSMYS